jgi:hypothetical protein
MLIPGIRGLKVANFSLSDSSLLSHSQQQQQQQHSAMSLQAHQRGQLRRLSVQPNATLLATASGGTSPQGVSSVVGAAASQEWASNALLQQQQQLAKQKAQLQAMQQNANLPK